MRARTSRSRSQHTDDSTKGPMPTKSMHSHNQSSSSSNKPSSLYISSSTNDLPDPMAELVSTATKELVSSPPADLILTDAVDIPDNGSSSLSELDPEEVLDDSNSIIRSQISQQLQMDVDSEAETERLDKSPNKGEKQAEAISTNDEQASAEALLGLLNAAPAVNTSISITVDAPSSSLGPVNDSSPLNSPALTLGKRKRDSPGADSLSDEPMLEPSPKRTLTVKEEEQVDLDKDNDEDMNQSEAGDLDGHEAIAEAEESNSEEQAADEPKPRPTRSFGKGKRRGRKSAVADLAENNAEASDTPLGDAEDVAEEEVEEEEEDHSQDEESAKRKEATEALLSIERDFLDFRKKYLSEQLQHIEKELDLLHQPSSAHPDFLSQMASVDAHRDRKMRYETTLLGYNLAALGRTTVAERQQFHSQYYQEVRQVRDEALEGCNKELYALQRERRRFGARDRNAAQLYNPDRVAQITWHKSYNMEVSILSGMAQNVGFPGAPPLYKMTAEELDQDLQAMGIGNRSTHLLARTLPAALESRAAAAEEQFLEQTPWANPQHPAHANALIRAADHPLRAVSGSSAISNVTIAPHPHPPSPSQQQQQQPGPGQPGPGQRNAFSAAPSFHIIANNQIYKVPVDEVVHPSTGMLVNSVGDASSSPILGAVRPTPVNSVTSRNTTLPPKSRNSKRPAAGTIIIMKEFESPRQRRSSNANNTSRPSASPKAGASTVAAQRNNQPAGLLPFAPANPVNIDVQRPFHAYEGPSQYGQTAAKDVNPRSKSTEKSKPNNGGRGVVPPVGRFSS